jgi:prepilin-type N-terminal cleavage/methylation domain-containing protein
MKNNKGFTLIEMLIVIAIIAILSGIVLVGVAGFQASARDARRIADIRNTQNLLELYYTEHGSYPKSNTADWSAISDELGTIIPTPTADDYPYYYQSVNGLVYTMGALLERKNSAAAENGDVSFPAGSPTCGETETTVVYCVTSL